MRFSWLKYTSSLFDPGLVFRSLFKDAGFILNIFHWRMAYPLNISILLLLASVCCEISQRKQ